MTENEAWLMAADRCRSRINTDRRNHQQLADPWLARARCIVQGWRNIASQGRLKPTLQPRTKVTTWNQSAKRMKERIAGLRRSRMLDKSTWNYWANHLPQINLRYVPKRNRRSIAPPERSASKA